MKRTRAAAKAGNQDAKVEILPSSNVFSKYAYQQAPSQVGIAVQAAQILEPPATGAPHIALAYENSEGLGGVLPPPRSGPKSGGDPVAFAALVASFADPSAAALSSSPVRRLPTHDPAVCSSPSRFAPQRALGTEPMATGGPPAATAELKPRWLEQIEGIVEMRSGRDAPVDKLGCERCFDPMAPPATQVSGGRQGARMPFENCKSLRVL